MPKRITSPFLLLKIVLKGTQLGIGWLLKVIILIEV